MGFLGSIFGSRRRREARERTIEAVRACLEREGPSAAWDELARAIATDPEPSELFHVAAEVLRRAAESPTAELFDRAADAPHDPQRLFELGSQLLSIEEAELAHVVLERALSFVPFDAVVRSELALAFARAGRPDRTVATLAMHPCLADDAGALFEFGWASVLCGDLRAARGALAELQGAPALRKKLEGAIERAELGFVSDPACARDYYFVETAGLLLDRDGPLGGRYDRASLDGASLAQLIAHAGWAIRQLVPRPRRVFAIDAAHWPLTQALARDCEGAIVPTLERGVLVPLWRAERIEDKGLDDARVFAVAMDFRRSLARAPDLVGVLARDTTIDDRALGAPAVEVAIDDRLRRFVDARRSALFGDRAAYVPDAPLPRRPLGPA